MGKTDKSYKAPGTGTAPSAVVGQVGSALKAQSTPLKTGKLSVPSSAVSNQHVKFGDEEEDEHEGNSSESEDGGSEDGEEDSDKENDATRVAPIGAAGDQNTPPSPAGNSLSPRKEKKAKGDGETRIVAVDPIQPLQSSTLNYKTITDFEQKLAAYKASGATYKREALLKEAEFAIDLEFITRGITTTDLEWTGWDDEKLFKQLKIAFPQSTAGVGTSFVTGWTKRIEKLSFKCDPMDPSSNGVNKTLVELNKMFTECMDSNPNKEDRKALIAAAINLVTRTVNDGFHRYLLTQIKQQVASEKITDFRTFMFALKKITATSASVVSSARMMGMAFSDDFQKEDRKRKDKPASVATDGSGKPSKTCTGCGREGHLPKDCFLKSHPQFNKDGNTTWLKSDAAVDWLKKESGLKSLPMKRTMAGEAFEPDVPNKKKMKRESVNAITLPLHDFHTTTEIPDHYVDGRLITAKNIMQVEVLLDTGAISGDYVNEATADWLVANGAKTCSCNKLICSVFGTECKRVTSKVVCDILLINNETKRSEQITLELAKIRSGHDIIIGRSTIKKFNLASKFPSHFFDEPIVPPELQADMAAPRSTDERESRAPTSSPPVDSPNVNVGHFQREHMSKFIDKSEDPSRFTLGGTEDAPWQGVIEGNSETTSEIPSKIFGTPEEIEKLVALCTIFKHIFNRELNQEPAAIPAMELDVDQEKWENMKQSRLPARVQSKQKQEETRRQVEVMTKHKIVQPSQEARNYSQVLLTPKPNGKWRFCNDYVAVNTCSKSPGWPLPKIQEMLQRIGSHKAKYYAVMDLTSGYHQAPLAESARIFTAFITFFGIFEWLRVPMGLKGAPAYFQKVLATVVLIGLIQISCELYIDDVLVYGRTFEEFLANLKKVFERFSKHKLTLNPDKCSFGLKEVEYVGHVINEHGLSHSPKRLEEVLAIEKPTHSKQLKSFLGVAAYFRDHIPQHSTIVRPLHQMLANYVPSRKLVWTPEAENAFEEIRTKIRECPTLFFVDDSAPIFVHTDASDYGIGAYLFQVIDGKERPVAFMSRALTAVECKWSTIEKECYAIVCALKKFEHLIRDTHFTLRTDHKNLTYVNDSVCPKVRRWKMLISEYDFDIEYIKGELNIPADAFSRLLPIDVEMVASEDFKIPKEQYLIMGQMHNSNVGHHGVERTMSKLTEAGHAWPHMREHVKRFIKRCPCCQKMSYLRVPIHTAPYTLSATEPMDRINIDTIGPLPPDDEGNTHIIVIIDCFSRWVELHWAKDATAASAAKALLNHTGRYGQPAQLLSDNGSQYVNEVIAEYTLLVGSEHVRTLAYSHEENGIVERANKEVMRHLRAIIFDKNTKSTWAANLPLVQRIMNSTVNASIGCTPADILFGNSISLQRDMYLPCKVIQTKDIQLSKWAANRLKTQQAIILKAQQVLQKHTEAHKASASHLRTEYPIGAFVLVDYPENALRRGPPNKLMPFLKGPMQVINKIGSKYTLQDLTTNKMKDYHVTALHPFDYDPELTDPRQVANKDQNLTDVEAVLSHKGKKHIATSLIFEIKFVGDDAIYHLPWSEVRTNELVHKYLAENNMKKLIPRPYK